MKIKKTLSFDDVLLEPQFSSIKSRKEVDISTDTKNYTFDLPIISSPMDTVTGSKMAVEMDNLGGLGIIHRYNSISAQVQNVLEAIENGAAVVGAAVGVSGDFKERAVALRNAGAKFLCIDIAHGHHDMMRTALHEIKKQVGNSMHVMAGNVATLSGFNDLADWGADSVRVGIGGGSICSTRIQTGHGVPTLQSVIDCQKTDRDALIIADGGIKTSGDIVKALAAGADFVMLGSMLAGTKESPGQVFSRADGKKYKVYRGMASVEAQVDWRGKASSLEGISTTIPYKGSVKKILVDLSKNIRSGLSYTGAKNLTELRNLSIFIQQTQSGLKESKTHILN
jgi:IMP dehydrogenase